MSSMLWYMLSMIKANLYDCELLVFNKTPHSIHDR